MYARLCKLPTATLLSVVLALGILAQTLAIAQPGVEDSKIHGDVSIGYYPISEVYKYAADLNVAFDFGSSGATKFFFNGGVLTLIDSTSDQSFQPDRYRGTLEAGARWPLGRDDLSLFVKHQSLHDIDRYDGIDEAYEILGLRYHQQNPWNFTVSAGNYVHKDDVDYDWDFAASVDNGCVGFCSGKPLYGAASVHYVTEEGSMGRDSFFDYTAEIGIENKASIRYFLQYQQIHDINRFGGDTERGVLVGVRYKW